MRLKDLPNGALVRDPDTKFTGIPIVWMKLEDDHEGYPANSTTLLMQEVLAGFAFDAREPENPVARRQDSGNNNYLLSNIRQWLNSEASAWYSPTHEYDKPPSAGYLIYEGGTYDDRPGFLSNLSQKFKASIKETTLTTLYGTMDEATGSYSHTDKVFLLSQREMFGSGYAEGRYFSTLGVNNNTWGYIFGNSVDRIAYLMRSTKVTTYDAQEAIGHVTIGGSPAPNNLYAVPAYSLYGVRPALNVDQNLPVSDTPDHKGVYTLTFNEAPAISGQNIDLGIFTENTISHAYTVTDLENDTVTVIEKLGNTVLRTYTPVLGETNTLSITADQWFKTSNGPQTITISAKDAQLTATRTLTFTRKVTPTTVSLTAPVTVAERPSRLILKSTGAMAPGANIIVEACNNGLDASPTWEDVTSIVNSGQIYFFTNKTKTAANWAFDIRVTMDRGTAEKNSWLQSLSGNFDSVGV